MDNKVSRESHGRFQTGLVLLALLALVTSLSCSDNVILNEALITNETVATPVSGNVTSGDIFIVSGGAVASTASPYPIHSITQWSAAGAFIRTIALAPSVSTYYYGLDLNVAGTELFYTVDTVDRIEKVDLSTLVTTTHILDAGLTGTTMRAMAVLSDGSVVAAESTTSVEKFGSDLVRVTANFPITLTATINSIKRISGNRFVILTSGGVDTPKVYNNDGTAVTTLTGLGCGNNCDPYDIVELTDGRFVVSYQLAAYQSLELFNSSFTYVGQLYKSSSDLLMPGALALLNNGNILACTSALNTCEEISVSGNTGSRVGTRALISDASLMRQPVSVVVAP